jgi:hyperosmotically inducible periplasmic protein
MFRLFRTLVTLAILVVAGLLVYNYWNGNGWTLSLPSGVEADKSRGEVAGAVKTTAEKAGEAASKVGSAVAEGTVTTKIKAKMALDDLVKASAISVETTGTVVTLTGRVSSAAERDRAVRLAQETDGVTKVVNKLQIAR